MGRLVGLELNNFKSYRGIVRIGFGDSNFTSIIGPNGSGKSNLMDAISFVLGIRSGYLRSHMLADLVYRGVIEEEADSTTAEAPAKSTESDDRPTTAYVKALYAIDDEGEQIVTLKRSISINQESGYEIDGKTVSYKKYSQFLENENILIKARNFLVFQGDVEQVAAQTPLELTKLLEQVSGSLLYKKDYDLLRQELEKASSATAELRQSRKRAKAGLNSFKIGINKDEEYKKYYAEKESLEIQYVLWKLFHLEQKKSALARDAEKLSSELGDLKGRLELEEKRARKEQAAYAKEELVIARENNKIANKRKALEDLQRSLAPISSSKEVWLKKLSSMQLRAEALRKDVERQQTSIKKVERQLKVIKRAEQTAIEELQQSTKKNDVPELSEEDKESYNSLKEQYLSSGGSSVEKKLAMITNDREELLEGIQAYRKRMEDARSKIEEELGARTESLEIEVKIKKDDLDDKNKHLSKKLREFKSLQSKTEADRNKEYELNYKLKETLLKLEDISATQRESAKEKKLRENVSTLRRLFPGVKGLVHDLCQPKKSKYALALSTVLGKNFDALVVDNFAIAQECIQYLKKQRSGAISFIPLDTIETVKASLPFVDMAGCILTIDAIDYDPSLERAMQYVCSNSMICDTLEIAKALKWQKGVNSKLVTVEGAIIHKGGLMTGGASKQLSNRWDKKDYQDLLTGKDSLLRDIDDLSTRRAVAVEQMRAIENDISFLNADIAALKATLSHSSRALKEVMVETEYQNDLKEKEFKPKLIQFQEKLEQLDQDYSALERDRALLQVSIFSEFSNRIGISIDDYEKQSRDVLWKHSDEVRRLHREIVVIENKLSFETDRFSATKGRLETTERDVQETEIKIQESTEAENEIRSQIKNQEEEISKDVKDVESLRAQLDANSVTLNEQNEVIEELTDDFQRCERKKDGVAEEVDVLKMERLNILKNCKMQGTKVPIRASSLDVLPLENVDRSAMDMADQIEVDFTELSHERKRKSDEEEGEGIQKSLQELSDLLAVLQPNAKASERYEDACGKFDQLCKEVEKAALHEKTARDRFAEVRDQRKEAFGKTFDHVNSRIDDVYRELTKDLHSTSALAGGSASLTAEDEEEPYLAGIRYHATPPTKRFKDMEYLSGGEKTIAALALLFAINSYQPSPFFVLDEVDAALDTANIERIATYIERHASPDLQFIVISLKNTMFEKSEALVGVFRQRDLNSSRALTLNLANYE
ncbi:LAMI_0F12464g1_1 [Lachancea mirantina]|uniref:Structural maintenance of chromosomes protein n=1 Tax=Lachancea mirantina TaxID=1230905 RepID=A0A1G4K307_9SACH|nr:LAMI_0F12464g1_1 [Lachancea mirantina]